jgi:DNA-binding transcriptional MerR regulator
MPKTKKDIIRRLKERGVKFNYRLFIKRQEENFIPDPIGAEGRELLYPDYTEDLLMYIEKSKAEGDTLGQIKKRLDERTEERLKICRLLGVKDEGQSFERHYLEKGTFIVSFYSDQVIFFLVKHPDGIISFDYKLEVVKQKIMPLEEYGQQVSRLAFKKAKEEQKVLGSHEIINSIFF